MANRDQKIIWGSILLASSLAVSAFFAPTSTPTNSPKPTPTKTVEAVDPTVLSDVNLIFDPSQIAEIRLDVPKASQKILANKASQRYVPAQFQITVGRQQSPKMDVAIRIKGTTSRVGINTTYDFSSYKVKFDFDQAHSKQTLLGLKSLTLNSMSQDSSKIHETFAYATYRAMGVPASRTGYANLTMSKNIPKPKRGLYLILESLDDEFLASNFTDVTQHLYESNHNFTEITPANVGGNRKVTQRFKVKEGWKSTPNRNDLKAFAKGIQKKGKALWDFLETNTDRDKLIMMFAVDNFTGGWDTYSGPLKNNYQFRSNQLGKMTFIPWGLDNTWGENWFNDRKSTSWVKGYVAPTKIGDDFFFPVDKPSAAFPGSFLIAHNSGIKDSTKMTNYQLSRGALFSKCLAYAPCATLYFQNLQKVSQWATETNLAGQMKTTARLIKKYSTGREKAEQVRTANWVRKQQSKVQKAIAKHCKLDSAGAITSCK